MYENPIKFMFPPPQKDTFLSEFSYSVSRLNKSKIEHSGNLFLMATILHIANKICTHLEQQKANKNFTGKSFLLICSIVAGTNKKHCEVRGDYLDQI